MAHNFHATTSANFDNNSSFFFFYIVLIVLLFSHRNHIVYGLYALSDLHASPSPQLLSLLKRTLPIYSDNDVRGKHLFCSMNVCHSTPSRYFLYHVFCLSFYSDHYCRRRKNNFWRYGSKEWSYPFY